MMFSLRIGAILVLLVLLGIPLVQILRSGVVRGGYSKSIARRDRPLAYWSYVALITTCFALVILSVERVLR